MYGISAFAQSPYASLGGGFYDIIVNETQTLTNAQSVLAAVISHKTKLKL